MDKAPEIMTEQELVHALDQNAADLAQLETRRLRLLAALDQTGHAERVGARDTVQFIEYRYRLDHHRARRDVELARALPRYEAVTAQLDEGRLRPAQAEAIVLELERTPSTVPVPDLEFAEQRLAGLTHLPPVQLRKAAIQARDILDTDGPEPEEQKAAARESLTLCSVDRGVKLKGYLANENAELLRTLIITGARPHKAIDGSPDPRPREKRQADALTTALTLATTTLDAGTPSPTIPRPAGATARSAGTTPPDPRTTTSAATTSAATTATPDGTTADAATAGRTATGGAAADADAAADDAEVGVATNSGAGAAGGGDGRRADVVPGFGAKANITVTIDLYDLQAATAEAIGQTVYSNGLSAATIRRLACDANVIPVVLGSKSEPLDVGRRERLVTKAIRRALNTRDRGCVVCAAPPVMCDAHHLTSWIDGGATALDNLVLLCRRHHSDLHNGHWHITMTNDVVHVARPAWADPPPPVHLQRPTTTRAATPGNEPVVSGPPVVPARASRWKADDMTLAEAARFAVWGDCASTGSDTGPPSFVTS
ncbi:DUF222 domain-containing protein [Kribbella sp. GL6]|uniref:HNH endonuclease signature motif containing protein n=1 Tax=Kribbella sp. GL6 TaxID=3419765 RepID=UPI003D015CF9